MNKLFRIDYELEGYILACAENRDDARNLIDGFGSHSVDIEELFENGNLHINVAEITDIQDVPHHWEGSIPYRAGDDTCEQILEPLMEKEAARKRREAQDENQLKFSFDMDFCPICGGQAVGVCRCMRSDSVCKNGHEWHLCFKHQKIVLGESDHSLDITECTCKETKE